MNIDLSILNLEHIVCLFDFSEESRSALSLASSIALQASACLHVIHVIPYIALSSGLLMISQPMIYSIFYDYLSDQGYIHTLEQAINLSVPKSLRVITHVFQGSRIQNLLSALEECHAGLLVLGCKHKRSLLERIFLPSITNGILGSAPCPVLSMPLNQELISEESYAGL